MWPTCGTPMNLLWALSSEEGRQQDLKSMQLGRLGFEKCFGKISGLVSAPSQSSGLLKILEPGWKAHEVGNPRAVMSIFFVFFSSNSYLLLLSVKGAACENIPCFQAGEGTDAWPGMIGWVCPRKEG